MKLQLNAELTEHLGYDKNSLRTGKNTRNGYTSKRLLTNDGEFELDTPRDRDGTFEPQLIKKNQTRITQMDSQIPSLYAKGMTTRDIVATFKVVYLAIMAASKKWTMPIQNWKAAMNHFSIMLEERVTKYF